MHVRASCCCSARRWRSRRSRPACRRSSPACCRCGAKQLAEAKAVVKNLTDVETLGATSAINTDKTGTLTMNQMMVSTHLRGRRLVHRRGRGLPQDRRDHVGRRRAGAGLHPARARARARQRRDRRRRRRGGRRPDRGGARRARGQARRRRRGDAPRLPAARRGAVRLRLQVHGHLPPRRRSTGTSASIELVKGGPDVVLARCTHVRRPAERLAGADRARRAPSIDAANARMGEKGLRVLAFAARFVDDDELDGDDRPTRCRSTQRPRLRRHGRASSTRCAPRRRPPSTTALGAGIDVRMITGDHAVTAQAIGETLGLGPGAISGSRAAGAVRRGARRAGCPQLHVFGRVSPRGQAAPRPADAGAGADRRDDRRRGQRRGRAQAGRHRRGDGQRQRGHQAGRRG